MRKQLRVMEEWSVCKGPQRNKAGAGAWCWWVGCWWARQGHLEALGDCGSSIPGMQDCICVL